MTFRIGQKVMCIKTAEWRGVKDGKYHPEMTHPQHGDICTIEDIEDIGDRENGIVGLVLTEFNKCCYYDARRFRPLTEKSIEASMAILKELLEPKRQTENV